MMKIVAILMCVILAGCSSTGHSGSRGILYGVDANGNALFRQPGEPPPRASAAQMCLSWKSCDEEDT